MTELRRRLAQLPQTAGLAAEELAARFKEEQTSQSLQAADSRTRSSFFAEVRLNLFRLSEVSQKELVEHFPELKAEIVRLVDSMTQEISLWLDEERVGAAQPGNNQQSALLSKLKSLFQAVLSAPFLATFRQLGGGEKRAKEAFLLKMALCLRKTAEKQLPDQQPELGDLSAQLRRQFFYVEGYGELMEEWLQSRVKQLNEDFMHRASAMLSTSLNSVSVRLRQYFRPGRWMFLSDPKLENDLISLFADESFPRHALTGQTFIGVLQRVTSCGGDDFHAYHDIVRLPPLAQHLLPSALPRDIVESALLEVLKRLPCFPSLRRAASGPGRHLFGSLEVAFELLGNELTAQVISAPAEEILLQEQSTAFDFFLQWGPREFPKAAQEAVLASDASPLGCLTTPIQDFGEPLPLPAPPMLLAPPPLLQGFSAPGSFPEAPAPGASCMVRPPLRVQAPFGFQASGPAGMPGGYSSLPAPPSQKFGLEDDEI